MNVRLSESVQKKLNDLAKKDQGLLIRTQRQLQLFRENMSHPSLRIHKLSGQLKDSYSLSVNRKIRMVYTIQPGGTAYFFDLGTHDEVYRK